MHKFREFFHKQRINIAVDPFSGEPVVTEISTPIKGYIVPSSPENIAVGFLAGSYSGFFRGFSKPPIPQRDTIFDPVRLREYDVRGYYEWEKLPNANHTKPEEDLYVVELQK